MIRAPEQACVTIRIVWVDPPKRDRISAPARSIMASPSASVEGANRNAADASRSALEPLMTERHW